MKDNVWKILTLLLIAVFALTPIKALFATGTLKPSSTISGVGGGPVVYDSGKGELFTQGANGIAVVSDSNNSLVTTISTAAPYGDAHELVYDSGKGEIFQSWGGTSDRAAATVAVISDRNNTVIANVNFGRQYVPRLPLGMAYDSGKGEVFICDSGYNTITGYSTQGHVFVVSDSNNSAITTINVASPQNAVYDSGKGEVFVASGSGNVTVISDAKNAVIATIRVGRNPYGMAYDSAKGEVYVFNENDGTISVINDSLPSVVETIKWIAVAGNHPISIAYNPAKGEIFASNATLSDSSNTVVAGPPPYIYPSSGGKVAQNWGDVAYDSGKGEVFASGLILGMGVISDSSSPTSTPSPTPSQTSTPTPSSSGGGVPGYPVASIAVGVVVVTAVLLIIKRKPMNK